MTPAEDPRRGEEQFRHGFPVPGVQRTRGFVRQQQCRLIHQRARHRGSLSFPAGEFGGRGPLDGHPEIGEQPASTPEGVGPLHPGQERGHRDVLHGRELRQQFAELEHHADGVAPVPGQSTRLERGQIPPRDTDFAVVVRDQPQQTVEQRALARPAGTRDGGGPSGRKGQVHAVEQRPAGHGVAEVPDLQDGIHSHHTVSFSWSSTSTRKDQLRYRIGPRCHCLARSTASGAEAWHLGRVKPPRADRSRTRSRQITAGLDQSSAFRAGTVTALDTPGSQL